MSLRNGSLMGLVVVLGMGLAACATPRYIQFRMAEPVVLPDDTGRLNPPAVIVQEHKTRVERVREDGVVREYTVVERTRRGSPQKASIAWENPAEPVQTRVELKENAAYHIRIILPEDFEYRRMALLRGKVETLYTAIENADRQLREDSEVANRLLSAEARQMLIDKATDDKTMLDQAKLELVKGDQDAGALDAAINTLAQEVADIESKLRADDLARDQLLAPFLSDSLVNQIEDWRAELNRVKSRIVALEMMVNNPNEAFPRVITGWIETRSQTPFTTCGALPFVLEDEYLDWVRQDKVVTIVSYDPNETPADEMAQLQRDALPEYWPSGQLTVIEFGVGAPTVPREARGGTGTNTKVSSNKYFNATCQTFRSDNGYLRTYVHSSDGRHMWVFGPDITPPANTEVWLQDTQGLPVQKLFPADTQRSSEETFVSQIAGVEGGAFDPVREAEKRGKVVAITRLGNRLGSEDERWAHQVRAREMKRARQRVR